MLLNVEGLGSNVVLVLVLTFVAKRLRRNLGWPYSRQRLSKKLGNPHYLRLAIIVALMTALPSHGSNSPDEHQHHHRCISWAFCLNCRNISVAVTVTLHSPCMMNDVIQVRKCFDTDDTKSALIYWLVRHSGTPMALPSVTVQLTLVVRG
jgi:hypothetical protein